MSTLQTLNLLLALSPALHIGSAGTHPATALLTAVSVTGTACALYLTAVSAYH
ncbi:hypothetical protein [Streptomyces sp. NPDC091215]|uniref:hypothetical protein n=1 Tax=Streptomyces sp. NPDC091215 TaxID=3155192 RepID=UPI0034123ABD